MLQLYRSCLIVQHSALMKCEVYILHMIFKILDGLSVLINRWIDLKLRLHGGVEHKLLRVFITLHTQARASDVVGENNILRCCTTGTVSYLTVWVCISQPARCLKPSHEYFNS